MLRFRRGAETSREPVLFQRIPRLEYGNSPSYCGSGGTFRVVQLPRVPQQTPSVDLMARAASLRVVSVSLLESSMSVGSIFEGVDA